MRASGLSAVPGSGSGPERVGRWLVAALRGGTGRPRRLCDTRTGDRVRLLGVPGREALRWLLLSGWEEAVEAEVLRSGRGGVDLSVEGRRVAVPGWVARATRVTRTR